MSTEETLIEVRKEKHQKLNGQTYPLADTVHLICDISYIMNKDLPPVSLDPAHLSDEFKVHGRISNFRKSGGISFIKVTDGTGSIQCIATKNVLPDYENLSLLDLGDIIEINGKACLSKTNEKSILILEWKVITKSHRPPPEKFAGIADQELKYRKRYLDLMSSEESRAVFTVRSYIIRAIRQVMENHHFMEVETSTLNVVNSGANAKPFVTQHNALGKDLFLRIAPELYLKRLLVGGFEKIYEIGRNYRNEGISTRHNPEFTMIEFYEAYGRFDRLISYANFMFSFIEDYIHQNMKDSFAYPYFLNWKEQRTFTFQNPQVITMHLAVIHGLNQAGITMYNEGKEFKIFDLSRTDRQNRINFITLHEELSKAKSSGERIAIYFEHVAEPFLTEDYRLTIGEKSYSVPVFITEYPIEICPLARPNDLNPSVCDRYELYINGYELCNAFQELNNPDEQATKFKEQLTSNKKDSMGYDSDYIEALEYGMPPAIGFGMGIDRLVMLMTNSSSIRDVILFPTLKPKAD